MIDRDIVAALDAAGVEGERERGAAVALYVVMSAISESCYSAGWMNGLEQRLWAMVSDPNDDRRYGQAEVPVEVVAGLRTLRDAAGGWWAWHEDPVKGPRFVELEAWRAGAASY